MGISLGTLLLLLGALLSTQAFPRSFQIPEWELRVEEDGGFQLGDGTRWWLSGPGGLEIWRGSWERESKPQSWREVGGTDRYGRYVGLQFQWMIHDTPVTTQIRQYSGVPLFLFRESFPDGITAIQTESPEILPTPYPEFQWVREDLRYLTYNYSFARPVIGDLERSQPVTGVLGGVPLVLFNSEVQTLILSPGNHFMTSISGWKDGRYTLGTNGLVSCYPPGFERETLLVGGRGVGWTMDQWGRLLLRSRGKKEFRPDVSTQYVSYWTGSGSYYKYLTEPGYTYQETLRNVYNSGKSLEPPILFHSIQLDSVWYPKDGDLDSQGHIRHGNFSVGSQKGQTVLWKPYAPEVFPNMGRFTEEIGGALILHNRMLSNRSSYCEGGGCVLSPSRGQVLPLTEEIWEKVWQETLEWKSQGKQAFTVYLQDWLKESMFMPEAMQEVEALERWLESLDRTAEKHDLSIMFSEPGPFHLLKSVELRRVNTARGSGDYQPGRTNYYMAYTGFLARVLGLIPFKQTFWSSEVVEPDCPPSYDQCREPNPEINILVAALSGGTVSPSDKIGYLNSTRISRALRADGLILKPSGPSLIPFDWAYLDSPPSPPTRPPGVFQENFTQVWYTESTLGAFPWFYILALNTTKAYWIRTEDLRLLGTPRGLDESRFWYYNFYQEPPILVPFTPSTPIYLERLNNGSNAGRFDPLPFRYLVVCPLLSNGWILLGERVKYVPISPQRLSNLQLLPTGLSVDLLGDPGEDVTIFFQPPSCPPPEPPMRATCTLPSSGNTTLLLQEQEGMVTVLC